MTCPNCGVVPPKCPICGAIMLNADRVMSPRMDRPSRIISHRWTCADGDGSGFRHYVEIEYPHKEDL